MGAMLKRLPVIINSDPYLEHIHIEQLNCQIRISNAAL